MYSYGPPHMAVQKHADQHEHTFSSCVRIRDAVPKTCQGRWTIGRSGERGSGISVLPARHDDDDDIDKIKRSFFQAAVVSILLYGCTTWTLTKRMEKKLDGNYTRMLRAILNKSWGNTQQNTNYTATYLPLRKLSKLDEPDTQNTAGEAGTSS